MDCPVHFFANGLKVLDHEADIWRFRKPQILSIAVARGQILKRKDLEGRVRQEAMWPILAAVKASQGGEENGTLSD